MDSSEGFLSTDSGGVERSRSEDLDVWERRRRASSSSAPSELLRAHSDTGVVHVPITVEDLQDGITDIDVSDDVFVSGAEHTLASRMRSRSLLGIQDQVTYTLTSQIKELHNKLHLKEEERTYLNGVPDKLTDELRELDITLEKEANTLIQDANGQRAYAEKMLKEANYKLEVLQAEVSFLKSLVITSTPSKPNRHLHPQIEIKPKSSRRIKEPKFVAKFRRSISTHSLNRHHTDESKTPSPTTPSPPAPESPQPQAEQDENREVDPVCLAEFKEWRASQPTSVDSTCPFLHRIIEEDVNPCLKFKNLELAEAVFQAILHNQLSIEPVTESSREPCALTGRARSCQYRICLGTEEPSASYEICTRVRNKIAVVCNFFMYIRYITQGLVNREECKMYWDIMELRREMVLAKLDLLK